MTFEAHKDGKTLADVRQMVEEIALDCTSKARASSGRERDLLLDILRRAEEARAGVLDLTVAMTAYVTHCLERETEERGPSL